MRRLRHGSQLEEQEISSPLSKKKELCSPKTTRQLRERATSTPNVAMGQRRSERRRRRRRSTSSSDNEEPCDVLVQAKEEGVQKKSGLLGTPRQKPASKKLRERVTVSKKSSSSFISKRQWLLAEDAGKEVLLSSSDSDEQDLGEAGEEKWSGEEEEEEEEEESRREGGNPCRVTRSQARVNNANDSSSLRKVLERSTQGGGVKSHGIGQTADDSVPSSDTIEEEEEE